jgi:hypothetical protein
LFTEVLSLSLSLSLSLARSLSLSLARSLTHSLTLTRSLPHSLARSLLLLLPSPPASLRVLCALGACCVCLGGAACGRTCKPGSKSRYRD